jgi:hypothetical protein
VLGVVDEVIAGSIFDTGSVDQPFSAIVLPGACADSEDRAVGGRDFQIQASFHCGTCLPTAPARLTA